MSAFWFCVDLPRSCHPKAKASTLPNIPVLLDDVPHIAVGQGWSYTGNFEGYTFFSPRQGFLWVTLAVAVLDLAL